VKEAKAKALAYFKNPQAQAQAETGSFQQVADNWFKRHVEGNGLRSKPEIERQLKKYVYPKWGASPFLDIRRKQVSALLDDIEDKHGKSMVDHVLATISSIMQWQQTRDDDYVSPIIKGMRRNNEAESRSRVLDDREIRALWQACEDIGDATYGRLVRVLLLTAQRRDKVATMRWVDLADGTWTIHTSKREKGNAGALRLPALALDLIAQQPRLAGNPYVFFGRGGTRFHNFSQRKHDLDALLADMSPWVLHDLRRTARSLLSRAGVRRDISERVLGHAITGVEGVYDRHTYEAEMADALTKLAAVIDTIINPPTGNVVALAKRKAEGAAAGKKHPAKAAG
jgi:integrase